MRRTPMESITDLRCVPIHGARPTVCLAGRGGAMSSDDDNRQTFDVPTLEDR